MAVNCLLRSEELLSVINHDSSASIPKVSRAVDVFLSLRTTQPVGCISSETHPTFNMLESVLADILTRILGQYLQGIDRESVKFGAWSGLIELRNVALRPEALAVLFETLGVALPVTVESGFIGLLRLVVPWKSIGSSPVQIHMHDVNLVARPVSGDGSDDSQLNVRERRINRAKLNTDDAVREASWNVENQRDQSNQSSWSSWLFSDQLRTTIINNIQIHLCDIIIRFEDPFSNAKSPYVASMQCESLKIMSTDSKWQETFLEDSDLSNVHKLLEIKGFQVNWAPIVSSGSSESSLFSASKHPSTPETDDVIKSADLLRKYVSSSRLDNSSKASPNATRSLVHRVDGSMRLRISSTGPVISNVDFRSQQPSADLDIVFPDVVIDLNDIQYACIVQTSLYFARIATRGFRPSTPKARWKWAVDQLLPGCTARLGQVRRFSAEGLAETRQQRDKYIAYRTSVLKARRTDVEEPKEISNELERMEDSVNFLEILAYRDAADAQIEKAGEHWIPSTERSKQLTEPSQSNKQGTTMGSFWSMLGYSGTSENAETEQSSISRERSHVNSKPTPPPPSSSNDQNTKTTLVLRAAFLLCSATVRLSQGGYPKTAVPRVELNLCNFRTGLLLSSAKDLVVEAVLTSIEVWDLQNNSRMVYSRFGMHEEDRMVTSTSLGESYPRDVTEAIEGIRSGLNPAKELLEDERNDSKSYDDEFLDEYDDESKSPGSSAEYSGGPKREGRRDRKDGYSGRESSPRRTYRITEEEFFGTSNYSNLKKYFAALRYTQLYEGSQSSSKKQASTLDVSVGTMEAIVDGPKGAFVWGLKFWQPKGLVQDPIMTFLGAAAGARIAKMRMEIQQALLTDSVPMQVNAVILAPRFIIPSASASSPSFVINMGTLGICTSGSPAHSHGHENLINEPKHLRYSNYVLTLDNLGMYFCPNLSTAVSCKPGRDPSDFSPVESRPAMVEEPFDSTGSYSPVSISGVERIIRPFSLRFVLQTLRDSKIVQVAHASTSEEALPSEEGIAKMRVRGNIPQLSLILTRDAFQLILTTADAWSQGLRSNVTPSHATTEQPSSLFLNEDIDRALLFNRETEALESDNNLPTLASYSVKVGIQSVSVEIRERIDVKLVTALASGLSVNAVKRSNKNMRADLHLRSWSITDGSRGSTAAFRRLLYSGTISASEGVSPPRNTTTGVKGRDAPVRNEENFVSIRYVLDLNTFEQKLTFRFLSLHMNCVRETYLRLLSFFDHVRRHVNHHRRTTKQATESASAVGDDSSGASTSGVLPSVGEDMPAAVLGSKRTSVVSEFDGFTLQLVAAEGVIAVFEMKDSTINFLQDTNGSKKAWGSFGSFSVKDLTAPLQEHVSALNYDRCSSVSVTMPGDGNTSKDSKKDGWEFLFPVDKKEPYSLNISFEGIHALFLYRFSEVLQDYVSSLLKQARPSLMSINEQMSLSIPVELSPAQQQGPPILMSLDLRELSLRIPRHSSCLSEAVTFKISTFQADNIREQKRMAWYARSGSLQGAVKYLLPGDDEKSETSVSSTFLNDCSIEMLIQPQSSSSQLSPESVLRIASMTFEGPLCINLSEAQYTVLYFVLTENFAESYVSRNSSVMNPDDLSSGLKDSSHDNGTPADNNVGFHDGSFDADLIISPLNPDSNVSFDSPTKKIDINIPVLSFEVSRGWDVTSEASKILGIYLTNVSLSMSLSMPSKKTIEIGGTLHSVTDLRPESEPLKRNMVVHLSSDPAENVTNQPMSSLENVSVTYEKEGIDRPSILLALDKLQLEMVPELLRDLTYMAIPGWPFLKTSAYAPEIQYLGRTVNLVLANSQVLLLCEEHISDRRALVLTGEFEAKMDWKRLSGAKSIVLQSKDLEVSAVDDVPPLKTTGIDFGYGFKDVCALPFEKSHSPLIYPSDSEIEFVGPGYDDAGRRINISVDAALCMLCTSEIPVLNAIMNRLSALKPSYISQRQWSQPSIVHSQSEHLNPKEEQKQKAQDSLKISVNIPVSRYVVTDDSDGRFVPVLEVRLTSLVLEAHGKSMFQIDGQVSMDLFNSKKGCWEPVVEPWSVSASLSLGQSGTRTFILKSEERLNLNIAPTTIATANKVGTVLSNATSKKPRNGPGISRTKSRREDVREQTKVRRPSVAAFLVRNELGIPITMCLPGKSKWTSIQDNTEVEIGAQSESLVSSASEHEEKSRYNALRCSIAIPSFAPEELSASESGKHSVTFYPRIDPDISQANFSNLEEVFSPLDLLWDVQPRNGVPVCTVRSLFRFVNKTKTTLDIVILPKAVQMLKEPLGGFKETRTISPGDYFPIPAHDVNGVVHIRPAVSSSNSSGLPTEKRFQWSPGLPKLPWLLTIAQERAELEINSTSPSARQALKGLPLVECKHIRELDDQGFFVKLVPSTVKSADMNDKSSWLDVAIHAPIILTNKLPGSLSYQAFYSERASSSSSSMRPDFEGSVLATGKVKSLDNIHLHISDEGMNSRFMKVAFDNGADSGKLPESRTQLLSSEFGPVFCLGNIVSGKLKAVFPSPAESEDLRGQTRKHFRANVKNSGNGTSNFVFYSRYWIRNRSDTAVEICSRQSFYSSGSIAFYLRERPPHVQPDDYVCCEGPFISIRLPSNSDHGFENRQSSWWTSPSILEEIEKPVVISLPGRSLELEVRPSIGLECGTHVVTIRNSSWIINSTPSLLQWCQQSALDAQGNCPTRLLQSLEPGTVQGLHWSSKTSVQAIHLRLAGENGQSEWIWSPAIPLDIGNSRELPAKMYRPRTHDQYIARVASKEIAGSSRVLVVYEEDRQNPPYRIVNMCAERAIAFSQVCSHERPWLVRAGKSTRYSWDDPLAPPSQRELSIRIILKQDLLMGRSPSQSEPGQRSAAWNVPPSRLNIDKVGDRVMVLGDPFDPPVVFNVSVDGATKIITLFDEGADLNDLMSSRSRQTSSSSSRNSDGGGTSSSKQSMAPIVEWDDISSQTKSPEKMKQEQLTDYPQRTEDNEALTVQNPPSTLNAAIFLDSIGISIIDEEPEELLYFLSTGILVNYEASSEEQIFLLTVDSFQVDNQIPKTSYPVLLWTKSHDLAPGSSETPNLGNGENHALAIELRRDMTMGDILMVKSFKAQFRPFNISFEEILVSKLLRLYNDSTMDGKLKYVESLHGIDDEGNAFIALVPGMSPTVKIREEGNNSTSRRIYVHQFKIGTSEIRLTSAGSGAALAKAVGLNASARAIVGLVLNVENCNFELPALSVDNVFDSLHHFGVLIRTYYIQQLSNQRIKLLTSNSLVNPAALFNAVGTGARDFLSEPGRAKGSVDFLASVGRGSKSLFTHTVGGFVDSVSSIPRAVSTGLERAVGDNDYVAERERIRGSTLGGGNRGSTKNPAQGLATGALSFAHGISSGVAGFIREPVQGAKQGGAGGLLKGIGKALVGGVAKPVAGAMDLVAEPATGFSRQIADNDGLNSSNFAMPDRPPRAFRAMSQKIERYDRWYSTGAWLMKAVCLSSGIVAQSTLVDWIELSDRSGRRSAGADLWVWYHVQRYSRYMPGMKKQVRGELRRYDAEHGASNDVLDTRPEKTRVALLAKDQIMIVTLDCKLIAAIPLWEDAQYEVVVDEKDLILRGSMLSKDDVGNVGMQSNSSLFQGAHALIQAPWDVSSTSSKRRKPPPGQSVIDRISCGSSEACEDLRNAVLKIVRETELLRERKRKQAWLSNDPMISGQELSFASQWDGDTQRGIQMTRRKTSSQLESSERQGEWSGEIRGSPAPPYREENSDAHEKSNDVQEQDARASQNEVGDSADEKLLKQLMDIGFEFKDAVTALADAHGDLVRAVDLLTSN